MATYSKSVLSYRDVHLAFEKAGELGQLRLDFDSPAQATTWGGRANAYRVLLRKQNEAAGRDFSCEFDHLMVRRKPGTSTVIIEPRGFDFKATGPDGHPIDFNRKTLDAGVQSPYEKSVAEAEAEAFLAEYEKGRKE